MDDISKLEVGKKYKFEMVGRKILGTAEKNTNTAWMSSSNQGGKLAKHAGIESLANVLKVTKSKPNVVAWPVKPNNVATGTVEIEGEPTQKQTYFTFKFDFSSFPYASNSKSCSFEVVYVFGKNHVPTNSDSDLSDRNSIFETYRSTDNRTFQFRRTGNKLTGIHTMAGIGTTKIETTRVTKTVSDRSGKTTEVTAFEGTFQTELKTGQRILGKTTITSIGTQGEIKISSSFDRDGRVVRQSATATRVSLFTK